MSVTQKKDDKKYHSKYLSLLVDMFKEKIDIHKKEVIYINSSVILNYLLFILTLIINLKDYPSFLKILLKKYFKIILNSIKEIQNEQFSIILLDLLNGFFLEENKSDLL